MSTRHIRRVVAQGRACEAVECVPSRPCLSLRKGYGFIGLGVNPPTVPLYQCNATPGQGATPHLTALRLLGGNKGRISSKFSE